MGAVKRPFFYNHYDALHYVHNMRFVVVADYSLVTNSFSMCRYCRKILYIYIYYTATRPCLKKDRECAKATK